MVVTLRSSDGRLCGGELEKAWCAMSALNSLSQGSDQPFATIIGQQGSCTVGSHGANTVGVLSPSSRLSG